MALQTVLILVSLTGMVGLIVGYCFRVLLSLSKKNSIESDLKERGLKAEEHAKKVLLEAEQKAADLLKVNREDVRHYEEKMKKTEERTYKKGGIP